MTAIYGRELKAYFTSPIAYIIILAMFIYPSIYFITYNIGPGLAETATVFSSAFSIMIILMPLLTMRLFTEERRQKTDQCLLCAPISLPSIVFGKILAACTVFLASMSIFIIFALVLNSLAGGLGWAVFWGNFLGMFLLGTAYIAIGTFISATTENQVVAAVVSFIVSTLLYQIDTFAAGIENAVLSNVLTQIGFFTRFNEFASGLMSLPSVFFFISVTLVFGFLTVQILERRRWG
jgi:ABC-2 type transport system permease protein